MSRDARAALVLAATARDLLKLGRCDLARRTAELALSTGAALPNCHSVMAGILEEHAEWDSALTHWRVAAQIAPGSPGHRHNLALALMLRDQWREAAIYYDARIEKPDWSSFAAVGSLDAIRSRLPRPDDDLAGKRVLVFTEQGLGDCIWAARWLPALARCGADVTVAARPALAPLIARIAPGLMRIGPPPEQPDAKINLAVLTERFDLFVPVMSLPSLLGVTAPGASAGVAVCRIWCRILPESPHGVPATARCSRADTLAGWFGAPARIMPHRRNEPSRSRPWHRWLRCRILVG